MKRLSIFLLLLSLFVYVKAQYVGIEQPTITGANNIFTEGDTTTFIYVFGGDNFNPGDSGEAVIWDFANKTEIQDSLEHYSLVSFLFGIGIWSVLMVITVYDLRTKLIPDLFNALFAGAALLLLLFSVCVGMHTPTEAIQWFVTGVALYLPFYALWKVSRGRWIGLGDGKLALGIGWFLGPIGGPSAVLFAFWAGAAISLLFIGLQQVYLYYQHSFSKKTALTLKSEIPFGPFLVLGVAIVYFTHITIFTLF